jgi:hypothetical protein
MRDRVDIDDKHSRAIAQEIGERLRASLRIERLPESLRQQIDRFRELEGQSPSIVPTADHGLENDKPSHVARRADRSRFSWTWRRER